MELSRLSADNPTNFGCARLLPMECRRALVFHYHGRTRGARSIWVVETRL